ICYNLALVCRRLTTAVKGALVCTAVAAGIAAGSPNLTPIATVRVGAQSGMLVPAAGSIWTTDLVLGRVVGIDPAANTVTRRIPFATRPFGLAYGAGSLWVADRSLNVLARINP